MHFWAAVEGSSEMSKGEVSFKVSRTTLRFLVSCCGGLGYLCGIGYSNGVIILVPYTFGLVLCSIIDNTDGSQEFRTEFGLELQLMIRLYVPLCCTKQRRGSIFLEQVNSWKCWLEYFHWDFWHFPWSISPHNVSFFQYRGIKPSHISF